LDLDGHGTFVCSCFLLFISLFLLLIRNDQTAINSIYIFFIFGLFFPDEVSSGCCRCRLFLFNKLNRMYLKINAKCTMFNAPSIHGSFFDLIQNSTRHSTVSYLYNGKTH
jgi:hypothetical protein